MEDPAWQCLFSMCACRNKGVRWGCSLGPNWRHRQLLPRRKNLPSKEGQRCISVCRSAKASNRSSVHAQRTTSFLYFKDTQFSFLFLFLALRPALVIQDHFVGSICGTCLPRKKRNFRVRDFTRSGQDSLTNHSKPSWLVRPVMTVALVTSPSTVSYFSLFHI